jgi:hypothetical protein
MIGTTRATRTYYTCPHDASHPRHVAAYPDHPKRILFREDHLVPVICDFFATASSGPTGPPYWTASSPLTSPPWPPSGRRR